MAEAPIIIKRKKVIAGGGHHGGAWKVAYADFVTAMMAFFLLMWLLGATTEDQRKGIADYFNTAIPITTASGGGADMLNGDSVLTADDKLSDGQHTTQNPRRAVVPDRRTLADDIERLARESGIMDAGDRVIVRQTKDGLVVELVDNAQGALFQRGSSRPSEELIKLVASTSEVIRKTGADIEIIGHTDATTYTSQRYSNWELSAERANAARRLLVGAGFPEERLQRVTGRADREPISDDPSDPRNRRIAFLIKDPQQEAISSLR